MLQNPMLVWLIIGVILLVTDKIQSRHNLIYASYSAFLVSAFIMLGIMKLPAPGAPDYPFYNYYIVGQVIVFIVGYFIWMFVLRDAKPKSKLGKKSHEFYQNIIGKTVEVASGGINAVSGGEVILNGKTMDAKLAAGSETTSVKAGAKMQVQEVIGDTLVVAEIND